MVRVITLRFSWVLAAALLVPSSPVHGQDGAGGGQWPTYGGDVGNTRYAALDQIGPENLSEVEIVWEWSSPDNLLAGARPGLVPGGFKATPLMVNGILYVRTSLSLVSAIDAATGEELWTFDPGSYERGRPTNLGFNTRGVAYWSEGGDARVFVATGDAHLWALDAASGEPIETFGRGGRIDLTQGFRRPVPRANYTVMSPPIVVRGVLIVGSSILDVPRHRTAPPGDVRGFDVRTGEFRWIFHTVPQERQFGNETWEGQSWRYTGNTNVWTIMSADEDLGYVYLPVGTPTNDWYGGHRLGDNLFAESLVALDAETGERVWHYQLVHHGVWDYDPPAAPTLVDLNVEGRTVRAVAQITKQGFVFVFDRETGDPLWPIEERPVPQSRVPGERLSPTQPFPTRPPPFEQQGLTLDDLIDYSPELRSEAERLIQPFDFGGLFEPPSERGTITFPGWQGGPNWQGGAVDPETGRLYIPSRTSPIVIQLVEADSARSDFRYVRGGTQSIAGPQGFPLVRGPHARLTAIDLNTGEIGWMIPLGDGVRQRVIDMGLEDPGPQGGGLFTGPLLTETLLFLGHQGAREGGSGGPALLALDKETGALLRAIELPAAANGTPMTYRVGDRQYIVVAVGGGPAASLVALAID